MNNILAQIDALNAQLRQQPLPPSLWEEIRADWEITHTYHSNAIEGNTLTLFETKAVLLDGITISGKPLREHLEAVNHREAMRLMWKLSQRTTPLLETEILDLHQVPLVPDLMSDFVQVVNADVTHPVLRAANAHYHFVVIHPLLTVMAEPHVY